MKTKQAEQKKTMDEIKTIIEKKKSWATLTNDEVAKLLDAFVSRADKVKADAAKVAPATATTPAVTPAQ